MWNFFKKETKKPVKKKPVNKGRKKTTSKRNKASDPLDILDRTLDKKLKEIEEHKIEMVEKKNEKESVSDKKAHIEKPADINFTQKASGSTIVTATSNKKETFQRNYSHFVQVLDNSIQDIEDGILYAGLSDMKSKQVLKQTSVNTYNISHFDDFINQFLDLTDNKHTKSSFLLIDLEKDVFLYIQIFELYYYTMLLDKNELSLGHVINIIKPELIKNYHEALNKSN